MKIGNISFNVDAIQSMTFEEFEKTYKGKVRGVGMSLEQVFIKLGGKLSKKKSKSE